MRISTILILIGCLALCADAFPAMPKRERFTVAKINFGDSPMQVKAAAETLGFQLARTQKYIALADRPATVASEQYDKPCSSCTGDYIHESLEILYTRKGAVAGIRRKSHFRQPIHLDVLRKAAIDQFGPAYTSDDGLNLSYSWRQGGKLERRSDQQCSIGAGIVPQLLSGPSRMLGCSRAVLYLPTPDKENPQIAVNHIVHVMDWEPYLKELVEVEKDVMALRKRRLEQEISDSKARPAPGF